MHDTTDPLDTTAYLEGQWRRIPPEVMARLDLTARTRRALTEAFWLTVLWRVAADHVIGGPRLN